MGYALKDEEMVTSLAPSENIHAWRKTRVKEEKSRLFWGLNFAVYLREEGSTAVHLPHCLAPQTYLASVILDREEGLKMAGGCWCLDH